MLHTLHHPSNPCHKPLSEAEQSERDEMGPGAAMHQWRWVLAATAAAAGMAVGAVNGAHAQTAPKHNVILFVADGLRSQIVTPQTAPALAAVRAEGVDFQNSHAVYP